LAGNFVANWNRALNRPPKAGELIAISTMHRPLCIAALLECSYFRAAARISRRRGGRHALVVRVCEPRRSKSQDRPRNFSHGLIYRDVCTYAASKVKLPKLRARRFRFEDNRVTRDP